jgi:cell division septation protein DedD
MRTLFDTEEEEIEGKASEITLSTASLLGIFFGLVLICGVFFGFGYSMGRGTGSQASLPAPANNASEADETAAPEKAPAPAPAAAQAEAQDDSQDDSQANGKATTPADTRSKADEAPKEDAKASEEPAAPVPARNMSEPPTQLVTSKPAAGKGTVLVAATGAVSVSAAPGSGQPMVQIAAVARPEDANVLVSALRQRGYGAVVRNDPQDKLLHVQVGPFSNRTQATAVKEKLLSDGYNAIIKQ